VTPTLLANDELLKRYSQGDRAAFEQLYTAFMPGLLAHAQTLTAGRVVDAATAQDLTSQVFVIAWEKRQTFHGRSEGQFAAYLRQCLFRYYLRKRGNHARYVSLDRPEGTWSALATLATNEGTLPDGLAADAEFREFLSEAMSRLLDRQRRVLQLRIQGHTYEEIAAREKIGVPSLKALLHRARRALRENLGFEED
jgi:RNA polymerase sigma-70 factor (ECF subfamily)